MQQGSVPRPSGTSVGFRVFRLLFPTLRAVTRKMYVLKYDGAYHTWNGWRDFLLGGPPRLGGLLGENANNVQKGLVSPAIKSVGIL